MYLVNGTGFSGKYAGGFFSGLKNVTGLFLSLKKVSDFFSVQKKDA